MKVALCMSGQPRFLDECYESILKNIIEPNNPDIFLHAWSYEDENEPYKYGGDGGWKKKRIDSNSHEKAIQLYAPLASKVEPTRKFLMPSVSLKRTFDVYSPGTEKEAEEAGMTHRDYEKFILSNNLSMWSSIYESTQMMYHHCLKTGQEYDAVIRCRFDINVMTPLIMSQFDQSYMYAIDMSKKYGHISDWLNFSSFENMMIYGTTFLSYKKIYSDIEKTPNSHPICNEMALAINLARHGIQCVNLPINVTLPRF